MYVHVCPCACGLFACASMRVFVCVRVEQPSEGQVKAGLEGKRLCVSPRTLSPTFAWVRADS